MVEAGVYENGVDEIDTIRGRLEIALMDINEPGRGKRVILNGKVIFEESAVAVSIKAAYPNEPNAKLVLFDLTSGHSVCPYFLKIMEIRNDGSVFVTEEFGNCYTLAEPKHFKMVKKNPVFEAGSWRIALPIAPNSERVVWYEYKDGKVWQNGKPARLPF